MKVSDRRTLGTSGLDVTILGLGGVPIGGVYHPVDERVCQATLDAACDGGIALFDTAPLYGYGTSEMRFGFNLRQRPRDSYHLCTKVGRYMPPRPATEDRGQWNSGLEFDLVFDYSYDATWRSVEQSMMRMGISRFDILLIHDCDVWTHGDQMEHHYKIAMDGAFKALSEMRAQGAVQAIGVGINEADLCARFARDGDFDCFLLAGRYTLLEQGALDDFLPLCAERNIGIMLGGPYNSGILATGPVPGAKYNYVDAPEEILQRVGAIQAVCQRHDTPLAAASMQFPLGHPNISSIVPGAVTPYEVTRNIEAMERPIPADLWAELKHEGLLREDAPVPSGG